MMNKTNFLLLILFFVGYIEHAAAIQIQSSLSIQEAIRHYIASNLTSDTNYKIKLGQADSRLKLPQCSEALEVFTRTRSIKPGRNSIGIKCNSSKKWTLYMSIIVSIYKDVIVLTQPIHRGEIFNKNSLQIEKRDISTLRSGFLTDPMLIINKQASRNLGLGSVINKSNITEPRLIKRGEKVYINATSPNLNISMAGIAMMDGTKGQNISVKNIKSQQIVQATVVQSGQVVIMF